MCAWLDSKEGGNDLYRMAKQSDRDGKDVHQARVIKVRDGNVLTGARRCTLKKEKRMRCRRGGPGGSKVW